MSLRVALAAVVLMVMVPVASVAAGAAWPQAGYDAARTGDVPGPGPITNDTAFSLQLPGTGVANPLVGVPPEPLILNGSAYVPVVPDPRDNRFDWNGIARVDLDTAEAELFVETERVPGPMASWQGHLFVTRNGGVDAYDLDSGDRLWSLEHPSPAVDHAGTTCFSPAVHDGLLLLPCSQEEGAADTGAVPVLTPFVWAVDASAGQGLWFRQLNHTRDAGGSGQPEAAPEDVRPPMISVTVGVSLLGPHVMALTFDQMASAGWCGGVGDAARGCVWEFETRLTLWNLDVGSGEIRWQNGTEVTRDAGAAWRTQGLSDSRDLQDDPVPPTAPRVTGTQRVAYAKLDGKLQAINPARGPDVLWAEPLGEADAIVGAGGASLALVGDAVYVASPQTFYRFDVDGPTNTWRYPLDPTSGEQTSWGSLVVADGVLHGMAANQKHSAVYALNAETGDLVWRHQLPPVAEGSSFGFHSYALGDGVLVAAGRDGSVHVIGETQASLQPVVKVTDTTPAPGEEVQVNLSGTASGAFGPATSYKADWGDGNATGWQEGPVLTHTYEESGPVTARFWVKNEANQTASTTHGFDVGATEPNFLETAFARENQDMTFGVLGILVAATGGAIGVTNRYRKRSRLQEELELLEDGFEQTRSNPGECEAFLDTRKARARSLMMEGTLTEEQFGVVDGRVAELRRELRTGLLDERLQFLPYGMVQSLKRMLADGEISTWERETVEELLEQDETLNEAQRERVRGMLERWSGAGGPTEGSGGR